MYKYATNSIKFKVLYFLLFLFRHSESRYIIVLILSLQKLCICFIALGANHEDCNLCVHHRSADPICERVA